MLARSIVLTLLALSGALSLTGCGFNFNNATVREERIITIPDAPLRAGVDVRTANGRVEIGADPAVSEATVIARLRARSHERLDDTQVRAAYEEGVLFVDVQWPDGRRRGNEGASFEITVPGAEGVAVDTGNGRITLRDTRGLADLHTSNGRVTLIGHEGEAQIRTSNGRIEIDGYLTDIDAQTSNGRIRVAGAAGQTRVRTSNGSVGVALTDDNPGPVYARSSNGSITLDLGPAFAGRLRLDTSNGRVRVEGEPMARIHSISRSEAEFTIGEEGEGGEESVADTSNGSVTVRFRGNDPDA